MAAAEKAVALDPNDAGNHWILGHVLAYERRWAESDAEFATALETGSEQRRRLGHADRTLWC